MASAPPDLPESIVVGQFNGIRNTVSEERLGVSDLAAAVNIDLDDVGQARRRRGYSRKLEGNWHSACDIAGRTFAVFEGELGTLDAAYNFTSLGEVGPDRLAYTNVGDTVFFSSDTASGKIVLDQVLPWGQRGGDGQWVSPVVRPTETLGAISGRMLSRPPTASEIEHYKGRIYLGSGPVLWGTELYLYDLVDKNKNYIHLPDDITMIRAVDDGLYVGTTAQLLFLQGTLSAGLKQSIVVDAPVIQGSSVLVPYSKAHPQARTGSPIPEGTGPMFMTEAGICLGLAGGTVFNLTQDRVAFPHGERAAALCRLDQGATSYLAVVDSAGGPSANARFGDYVDAEIVRASQRG